MDDEKAGAGNAQKGPPPGSGDSIHASVERLIASGKDLAEAEISWAKLKGRSLAATLRKGLVLALVATTGLMVGCSFLLVAGIFAIAPHVGGLLNAILIMSGIAFALAIIFGLLARNAFRQLIGEDEA